MVGEEQQFHAVGALAGEQHLVAVLQLLFAAHAQALGRDLLEVAVPGEEQVHRVIGDLLLGFVGALLGNVVQDLAAAGLAVLFAHLGQFRHDDAVDARRTLEDVLQVLDGVFQFLDLGGALEDVFPVQVAQLDLGHILGLYLVDAEPDHQIGDDLRLFGGAAHDLDGFVDIQQDGFQALEQMQAFLLALQIVVGAAAHALRAERDPLQQDLPHAQHFGLPGDQHVEVAGEVVLQRGGLEQPRHQLVRVLSALEVDGQFQAVQVGFVAHVADLADLAQLDQLGDLVHDGLHRGGGGNMGHVDAVVGFVVAPPGAYPHAAAAVFQHVLHLGCVVQDGAAAYKIGGGQNLFQFGVRVFHQRDGGAAELRQVERTDVGRHAHGDAQRVVGQDRGEGHRQQRGFGGGAVVVGHKIHGVLINVAEQFLTHRLQLGLGVTGGGVGHVAAVRLAEVALGIHKGNQQALVGTAHAHHRVVDGRIAVGVQVHRAAHDVGTFGAHAFQQAHGVHRVQQLAVRRFEPVDLRQGAGYDDAHRVGHIVGFEGLGDGGLDDLTGGEDLHIIAQLGARRRCFLFSFFRHSFPRVSLHPDRPDIRRRVRQCAPCGPAGCRPAAGQRPGRCVRRRWAAL